MDASSMHLLESLFYQKIMLRHDLLHCFNAERKALMEIDLDQLWEVAKEKEEIASKINSVQQEMISTFEPQPDPKSFHLNRLLDMLPRGDRAKFNELYRTLLGLKREIEALRKENMLFVDDSLHFLDEMISVITSGDGAAATYDDKCRVKKSDNHILITMEA